MNISIDMRTLFLASGLVILFLSVPVTVMAFGRRTYPGGFQWAAGAVVNFLGLVLIGLRGSIPDFLSVVVANVFAAGTVVFVTRGLLAFAGDRQRTWLDVGSMVVLGALMQASLYPWPSINARIAAFSIVLAFLAGRCFLVVWRRLPRVLPGRDWLLLGSIGFTGAWHVLRAVLAIAVQPEIKDFLVEDTFQALSIIVSTGSSVIMFISLIVAKVKRLERALVDARREVDKLSGLLPICSECRRIRNEDGSWTHIETYVGRHSDVAFTHSLCPDCTKALYPEVAAEMEKERRK